MPALASHPDERRVEPRMPVDQHVLLLRGEEAWSTSLEDISATGCRVRRFGAITPVVNDFVALYLYHPGCRALRYEGRVTRVTDTSFGLHFQPEADPSRFPV